MIVKSRIAPSAKRNGAMANRRRERFVPMSFLQLTVSRTAIFPSRSFASI
jgi:hypothetical protein